MMMNRKIFVMKKYFFMMIKKLIVMKKHYFMTNKKLIVMKKYYFMTNSQTIVMIIPIKYSIKKMFDVYFKLEVRRTFLRSPPHLLG